MENKLIKRLVILNLIFTALILAGKLKFIMTLFFTLIKGLIIPVFIAAFIFYIIRPLNDIFKRRGIKPGKSSFITLSICTFILSFVISYVGKYAYGQFNQILHQFLTAVNDRRHFDGIISWVNQFININEIYALLTVMAKKYIQQIGLSFIRMIGYFMNTFSMVFLIIVIVFYMLKDGHKLKNRILSLVPSKYKNIVSEIIMEGDCILSHYVTGQAKVALFLALIIFTGYLIIGMPNAMLLSLVTFMLAFIPFVGFFISMIIPFVIAVGMGMTMLIKLAVLFTLAEILKGRVVVPVVMSKSMNIHPLTDIFLVVGAIAAAGPFAAFAIVPVYAFFKNVIKTIKRQCVNDKDKTS